MASPRETTNKTESGLLGVHSWHHNRTAQSFFFLQLALLSLHIYVKYMSMQFFGSSSGLQEANNYMDAKNSVSLQQVGVSKYKQRQVLALLRRTWSRL